METLDPALAHHGVKGMKWGVRRDRGQTAALSVVHPVTGQSLKVPYDPKKISVKPGVKSHTDGSVSVSVEGKPKHLNEFQKRVDAGHKTLEDQAKLSTDFKSAMEARSKDPAHLSNQEMQNLINRMNLERQYKQLLAPPPPPPVLKAATRKQKTAKFVHDLLLEVGKEQIKRVAKAEAGLKTESLLAKNGRQDLVDRLTGADKQKKDKKKKQDQLP